MTVQELIERLQSLPGDLSILPVQIQESYKRKDGFRETNEYPILDVRRDAMAVYLQKEFKQW